jgi:hypothetical protein
MQLLCLPKGALSREIHVLSGELEGAGQIYAVGGVLECLIKYV